MSVATNQSCRHSSTLQTIHATEPQKRTRVMLRSAWPPEPIVVLTSTNDGQGQGGGDEQALAQEREPVPAHGDDDLLAVDEVLRQLAVDARPPRHVSRPR